MKTIYTIVALAFLSSCTKENTSNSEITDKSIDSTKIIDSINKARTKINDSIRNTPRFKNLSGTHQLTHNMISGSGKVNFTKIDGNNDEYSIEGEDQSGKNYLKIKGTALRVSEKHFNFYGEITQSIQDYDNGKPYTRKGSKTFLSKDGGKTWRLQDMVNDTGFADYIDIKL